MNISVPFSLSGIMEVNMKLVIAKEESDCKNVLIMGPIVCPALKAVLMIGAAQAIALLALTLSVTITR